VVVLFPFRFALVNSTLIGKASCVRRVQDGVVVLFPFRFALINPTLIGKASYVRHVQDEAVLRLYLGQSSFTSAPT
jgi:hypothetical protein